MRVAGRFFHPDDLVVDLRVAPGEERAAVDHHVDFVGAVLDDPAHLLELRLDGRLARGKRGRDRCDLDVRPLDSSDRGRNEVRIDADRSHRRDTGVARVGPNRLRRQRCHLARSVLAFERRQIHHSHGQLEREDLRLLLDRPFRQ